ncbi:hypothetical protein A8926_1728 [Saccharopolyspora spinosa]|uniref:Uncharacterized protein n=2 Tax=Saccharopolyspora spinosa TaxID=60894 RepID=A0A2N3XU10_SACSN|nr:hypothetical protein A8926_1728 [Saccharopolyspora spinosa]
MPDGTSVIRRPPIARYRDGRALVDRASLARLTGRSVHTIRRACPIADRDRSTGRPLYDTQQCNTILNSIPTRKSGSHRHLTASATSAEITFQ